MDERQDEATGPDQQLDQLQQELHAKDLLLEALRYENKNLKQYSDRHYDPASSPNWKSYDALKKKVVEYQKALEQRDHIIGQMEAGIKQLMHKNVESEAKAKKAEEHYSEEIQTLAQHVQELTAQLTITSHQHQAAMRAAQDRFSQQLANSQQQMRDQHDIEVTTLREKHASEMGGVTLQLEALEKSQKEEHHKLVEHLTHLSNSLGTQLEEEREKVLGLRKKQEEWELHTKKLEAQSEEMEILKRNLDEHITAREDLQQQLRNQVEQAEEKRESLHNASERLSQDLKAEIEQRSIIEAKLEEEIQNARKLLEQKTALEGDQKQLDLQLHITEEELAKAAASRVSDIEKLETLAQKKEVLSQENEVLTKNMKALTQENMSLILEKELLEKEKDYLLSEKQSLTKEKECFTLNDEELTKENELLTLLSKSLTKEKETLASEYKIITKEKEAVVLENNRILSDKKIKEKEKEDLVKQVEALTKLKDCLIIEKDILLKDKKDSSMEKDLWTREKEALLTETKAWAAEKENLLKEKESLLLEKKNYISENETLVKEKITLNKEIEILSSEKEETKNKEKLTAYIDALMSEKNILLKEKEDLHFEKNSWTKEKTTLLQRIEAWAAANEDLLSEKESLLSETKAFFTERETWHKDKQNLSCEIDFLCSEKNYWSQKEESLNKKNESLSTENKILAEENKSLVSEKEHLLQQNISLNNEKEMLTEEKKILMKQIQNLNAERENLVHLSKEFTQKNEDIITENETLKCQIIILQRENEVSAHDGNQVSKQEALLEEMKSLRQEMDMGRVERKHLEEKCACREAELKKLEERYMETLTLKESHLNELEESIQKKIISKDIELQQLEKIFEDKFSLKEKEVKQLEDVYKKMHSQKDHELEELSKRITQKENELQEFKRKENGMEKLHENCLTLLEHLQSGEKERKKVEEECEDKCEMLNNVLRNIDLKLCEAASLVSKQMVTAEEMLEAGPRSHLKKVHTDAHREMEIHGSNSAETAPATMQKKEDDKERESYKISEELHHVRKMQEGGKRNEDLTKKLTSLEKEKDQLANEAEVMHKKIHNQHFTITSLQNEKSRLSQYIIQLEGERSTLRGEQTLHFKDNLNMQEELITLRTRITAQKQKLEFQEEKIKKFNQAHTALIQEGVGCPKKLKDRLISLSCLSSKLGNFGSSENMDDPLWLTVLSQELQTQWEHYHTTLHKLIDLQQCTDNLHHDRLQTDLENISLHAELEYLRHCTKNVESWMDRNLERKTLEEKEGNESEDSVFKRMIEKKILKKTLEEKEENKNENSMLKRMKEENKKLKQCLDNKSVLLRLERLHLLSPKPNFERELDLCLMERKLVMHVVRTRLEHFVAQWKLCDETHPSVRVFAEALGAYIEDFSGQLLGFNSDDMSAEIVVRCLQQAMVKTVSKDYQKTISATLGTLEQDLSHTLHHIILPSLMNTPQRSMSSFEGVSLQNSTQKADETKQDSFSSLQKDTSVYDSQNLHKDLTAKVEHLINVRTALVDAANELNQELEEVLGQHLNPLKEQLQDMQHLQGLYNDRDWYKKTVGLLSHVTLQLLHYYSVAQSLTHRSLKDNSPPCPHPPESPTPGRILDLSFLSDCIGEEEEEMLAFSEEKDLATGLMGRTAYGAEEEMDDTESALDGTAISESMMDDLDKDELVRTLLERSYPQLMAILKGRWDRVQVTRLEKEVQELTISLQASAGMLRIFIHSMSNDGNQSPHILMDESQEESIKNNDVFKIGHSESSQKSNDMKKESKVTLGPHVTVQETVVTKDTTFPPTSSILQQDLSCISETLIQLLSQEESLQSFTMLIPHDLQDKEQLRAVLRQLCEAAQATESLKLDLHHSQGLQQGLEEERHNLQEEVNHLTHYSKNLAHDLQVLKDQLEESSQENQRPVSHYAAKMEATKDVRERVRAALSAKNVAELGREQLEARVRELEDLLEMVVRESEKALDTLRTRETDLSQQLEVADRQLKSARQFLEEHASERDQEMEELVGTRDRLASQLRDREAQLALQVVREKEVENLERQLKKTFEEVQEALSKKEELQIENRTSKDKISDLREIIQSLESQVDGHCMKEAELTEQVEALSDGLTLARQQAQHLHSQMEELRSGRGKQVEEQSANEMAPNASEDKAEGNICQHNTSLLSEFQKDFLSTSILFQLIEKRLRDTTRCLEAMQLSGSLEDISAQDVEVTVVGDDGRFSPSTFDRRLEDQLVALEYATEAAIKRNKDLQIIIKNLQTEFEEVIAERDTLQEQSRMQLVKIASLEAGLDEVRRADHPAASDMRQRLVLLQENLEEKREELTKKSREIEELKYSLSSLREQLVNREGELEQLQSASLVQPHSPLQTFHTHPSASYAHLEKDLSHKTQLIESLQKEMIKVQQSSTLPPSLAEDLISEKNADVSELKNKIKILTYAIQKVYMLFNEAGNRHEAQQILSNVLDKEFADALNESEDQDVLRQEESEQISSKHGTLIHSHRSSAVGITVSQEEYEAMCSANMDIAVHKAHIELLIQEIQSLNDYQAHLEEDYKAAKELLEAREAEILQLTEEVMDSPPLSLPSSLPNHLCMDFNQEVSSRLKAYEEQVDHLSSALQRKSEEVQQLSIQLEHVHAKMKKRLFEVSMEAAHLQQQLQQEITDLKEQHIAREKKLCCDYEERMAKQIEDLAQCINKNKEAAMARQQEVFEITLRQAALERNRVHGDFEQSFEASPSPHGLPQSHLPVHQTANQLCASVDTLIAGLKQELEKSGQLDHSMASLMRTREGEEASTQASSTFSDASDEEESAFINGRIQHLMNKIHKDGIEMLTLIDIMFLRKHSTQLDTSQRSFITNSSLIACSLFERGNTGEQAQLMRNLADVEEELAKMEQEMKRKIGILELQLEQERMSGSEWKLSFESEKQHTRDLMEQLRKEQLAGAEYVSELTLLRSQLLIIRLQHQKLQEENYSLSECQEKKDLQMENLQAALEVERNNFSRVSKILSEERKVSSLTQSEQEAIIKRQLAVEKERFGELERVCEKERLQAVSQKEQATAEKAQSKVEVRMAKGRLAELMTTIRSLETEKQRLKKQMQQLYGCYLQREHWRMALVWQKQYLMLVIKGYSDTEQQTLARLTAMAPLRVVLSSTSHHKASHSKGRFRVAVLVVIAMCRMKNLVLRFHRKKMFWLEVQDATYSTVSSSENSLPDSSSAMARGREVWSTYEGALATSFTGLTPPTREPGISITHRLPSATQRSLFQEESEELNQYVERLDNIHLVLGLTHRKQ